MSVRLTKLVKRDLGVDPEVTGVTADSRKVKAGFLFAALPGSKVDGSEFAAKAVDAGAAAVIAHQDLGLSAPTVTARDPRRVYALAAAAFWGSQPKTCVAVTGTNGKTSVANFCRQMFARAGKTSASMGTLGVTVTRPDGARSGAASGAAPPRPARRRRGARCYRARRGARSAFRLREALAPCGRRRPSSPACSSRLQLSL